MILFLAPRRQFAILCYSIKISYYRGSSRSLLSVHLLESILKNINFSSDRKKRHQQTTRLQKTIWLCYDSDSKISRMILVRYSRETSAVSYRTVQYSVYW